MPSSSRPSATTTATFAKDGAGELFGWGINYYAGGFV